jgi:dipeptidase E
MKRKLVLYSEQEESDTTAIDQRLLALMGKRRPRLGYIPSSGDTDRHYYQACRAYYARLDADLAVYFELDDEYDERLLDPLLSCDAIHLSGGNTFYFLHRLRIRNMLAPLRNYVADGGLLIGVSAGAILMTPDVGPSSFCGDERLACEQNDQGMALVDFAFAPHWGGLCTATVTDLQEFAQRHNLTVYACPDGGGIVVEDEHVELIGDLLTILP